MTTACNKKGEDCAYMMGLDDATECSAPASARSRGTLSPMVELNDAERKLWDEWEERDDLSGRTKKKKSEVDSTRDQTEARESKVPDSSSSSLDSSVNRMQTAQRRKQAQTTLLDHAEKAQKQDREQMQSILSVKTEETEVSAEDKSTGTTITFVQREVLQKFSSMLRNDKVEVLKLNRHNKWQLRYITVSKEVAWLKTKTEVPPTPTSSQCPQALLWYKTYNTKNTGLTGLKNDGRGGFLFSQLKKIERDPNVVTPFPIPRKLQKKFRPYAGVKILYHCDEGERDLLFCFQDPSDAKAFCTAVEIIHQVVMRTGDDSQS